MKKKRAEIVKEKDSKTVSNLDKSANSDEIINNNVDQNNSNLLKKIQFNELVIDKLKKEIQSLRNENSAAGSEKNDVNISEILKKDLQINELRNNIEQLKEKMLINESISRKKDNELKLLVVEREQLKKRNLVLVNAFSQIKNEHMVLAEAVSDLKNDFEIKLKENDVLRKNVELLKRRNETEKVKDSEVSKDDKKQAYIELLSAKKKLRELNDELEKIKRENILLNGALNKSREQQLPAESKKESLQSKKEDISVLENFRAQLIKEQADKKSIETEMLKIRRDFETLNKQIQLKDIIIEKLRKENYLIENRYADALNKRGIVNEYSEKIDGLRTQVMNLSNEISKKEKNIEEIEEREVSLKEANSLIVEKLVKENENLKNQLLETRSLKEKEVFLEIDKKRIKESVTNELNEKISQLKEQLLISESTSRKKDSELQLFEVKCEQLNKRNKALMTAFSQIKNEHMVLAEAVSDLKNDFEIKLKENDALRKNIELLKIKKDSEIEKISKISSDYDKKQMNMELISEKKRARDISQELEAKKRDIVLLEAENKKLKDNFILELEKEKEAKKISQNRIYSEVESTRKKLSENEGAFSKLAEENKYLKMQMIEKSNTVSMLSQELERKNRENILISDALQNLKDSLPDIKEVKKVSDGKASEKTKDYVRLNILREQILRSEEERKNIELEFLKSQRDVEALKKQLQLKDIMIERARKDNEGIKTGYVNELHNRQVIDEYASKIDELRKQVLNLSGKLQEKEKMASELSEENKVLKEEISIELVSRETEKLMEKIDVLQRDKEELGMLAAKEKENSAKMNEYYTRMIELQKTEHEERLNELVKQAAEREVELNSIINGLNQEINEQNRKIGLQKDFYLDLQRKIRQNILDSGIIKEEETKRDEERKTMLSFVLNKKTRERPQEKRDERIAKMLADDKLKRMERPPIPINPGVKLAGTPQRIDRSDEILSVIKIAKQHGDTNEQIKISLINSGYNGDEVDMAFSRMR